MNESYIKYNVIFDFDGVIEDTWEATILSNVAISGLPREEVEKRTHNYFSVKPIHSKGADIETLQKREKYIFDFAKEMLKYPNKRFDVFVDHIKSIKNIRYAIVSSGTASYIKQSVLDSGLMSTHILTAEDHHSKEEKIALICKDWGIEETCVYYVTDTQADVYELEGFLDKKKIIGCAWGFQGYDKLKEVLPESQIMKSQYGLANILYISNAITCGEVLPDCKEVTGSTVIAYDKKKDLYLKLNNLNTGETWLPSGGLNVDSEGLAIESYEECARRELAEEAGIEEIMEMYELGVPIVSYYYNANKKSNRKSLGYNYLAIVDSNQMVNSKNESHESFTSEWVSYDDIYKSISSEGTKGVEHWLQALAWAKEKVEAL